MGKIEKYEDLSSNHTSVILIVFKQAVAFEPPLSIHSKNTNWDLYREIISSELNLIIKLKTGEDVEMFNSRIHLAATTSTLKNRKAKIKWTEFSKYIMKKTNEWRKIRKEWYRNTYSLNKTKFNSNKRIEERDQSI